MKELSENEIELSDKLHMRKNRTQSINLQQTISDLNFTSQNLKDWCMKVLKSNTTVEVVTDYTR